MTSAGWASGNTQPTEEDDEIAQLRRAGLLGPFEVVDWAAESDTGAVRERNEDRWRESNRSLFVLADGMGGHSGGDIAAEAAADAALALCSSLTDASAVAVVAELNDVVATAGEAAQLDRIGTTLVTLSAHQNHVVVLNIGDSRVYRMRNRELEQVSVDHTVRSELIAAGVPLERAEETSMNLGALTSHLGDGRNENVAFHVASYSVAAADRFLLCSDGIHGQLDHAVMQAVLSAPSCTEAAQRLTSEARIAGGRDNATAVVIEFAPEASSVE